MKCVSDLFCYDFFVFPALDACLHCLYCFVNRWLLVCAWFGCVCCSLLCLCVSSLLCAFGGALVFFFRSLFACYRCISMLWCIWRGEGAWIAAATFQSFVAGPSVTSSECMLARWLCWSAECCVCWCVLSIFTVPLCFCCCVMCCCLYCAFRSVDFIVFGGVLWPFICLSLFLYRVIGYRV